MGRDMTKDTVPLHGGAPRPAKSSCLKKCLIILLIIIVLLVIIGLAVGLGVGLGIRYARSNDNSTTTTTTAVPTSIYQNSSDINDNSGSSSTNPPVVDDNSGNITNNLSIISDNSKDATASLLNPAKSVPQPPGTFSILAPPEINCIYDPKKCGCASSQPLFTQPRIFQGYAAQAYSWPWVVKLIMTINGEEYGCGGFLMDYNHVVTASHCTMLPGTTPNSITVHAGIQKLSDLDAGQTRGVSKINMHPYFDTNSLVNDIAILTLDKPITPSENVSLCCVSDDTSLPHIGQRAVIVGWGYTEEGGPESDDLLQAVTEIQPTSTVCKTSSTYTQFCAGFNGTDVCQGDSGGPLMAVVNNAWTCVGVVSYGPSCHEVTTFTRIAAFKQFINGIISNSS